MAKSKVKPRPANPKVFKKGLEIRKAVLGKEYVENSIANADDFTMAFQEITTEYCWGYLWGRDGLPRKTRSMLNLAMLAALNRQAEFDFGYAKVKADSRAAPRAGPASCGPATASARGSRPSSPSSACRPRWSRTATRSRSTRCTPPTPPSSRTRRSPAPR